MTGSQRPSKGAAFSLVEVVVAIGIVTFALVSIISLISLGLQSSKDSTDDTNIALMTQTVITLLRTNGYVNVTGTAGVLSGTSSYLTCYFDSSGNPLHSSTGLLITGTSINGAMTSNTSSAISTPVYLCTVTNRSPAAASQPGYVYLPQPTASAILCAWLRLDFSWPYAAPAANQQHKYVYASLAQYN